MYQAPEVIHLQRAVEAVKKGLVPELSKTPSHEPEIEREESETENEERTE